MSIRIILIIVTIIILLLSIILSIFFIFNLNKKEELVNQTSEIPIINPRKEINFSETGKVVDKGIELTYVVGRLKSVSEKFGEVNGTFEISTGDKKNQNFLLFNANSLLSVEIYKTDNINEIKDEKREYINIEDSSKAHEYLKKNIGNNFLLKIVSSEPDVEKSLAFYLKCNKTLSEQLVKGNFTGISCTPFVWTLAKYEKGN